MDNKEMVNEFQRTAGPTFIGENKRFKKWCVDIVSPEDKKFNLHSLEGLQNYFKTTDTDFEKLRAAFVTAKLWAPNSNIIVGFLASSLTERNLPDTWAWKRAWVAKVITDTVANYTNLTFQFKLNPSEGSTCNIRISFDESGGCYSRLGTDALQNWGGLNETMNFGWMDAPFNHSFTYNGVSYTTPSSFDQGGYPGYGTTIIHEFGHALGMIHEHQTPFGNPIQWNTNLIYQIFQGPPNNWSKDDIDFNIINRYNSTGLNGSSFDAFSIMKYPFPSNLLLNPSPDLISGIQKVNLTLSNCDMYWLSYNYPGKVSQSEMINLQNRCTSDCTPYTPGPSTSPTSPPPTTQASSPVLFYIVVAICMYILYLIVKSLLSSKQAPPVK